MNCAYTCIAIGGVLFTLWAVWRGRAAYRRTMGHVLGSTRVGGDHVE